MAGFEVSRALLDQKAAEAVLAARDALARVETIRAYLVDHPGYDLTSPLVAELGYTTEEAYLLQSVFQELDAARTALEPTMATARKLTGLQ